MTRPKALIAISDTEWQTLFADRLAAEGVYVCTTADGLEALSLARRQLYEVLVIDTQLPQMDAMELVFNLRDLGRPLPVVVVTGLSDATHAHVWRKLGVFFAGTRAAAARHIEEAVEATRTTQSAKTTKEAGT